MEKIDVRVKRTYNMLFDALMRLLSKKSFDDVTIVEICNDAQVHRATFYKHFIDKYDFLNSCVEMKLKELDINVDQSDATIEGIDLACRKMLGQVADFVEDNSKVFLAISNKKYSYAFDKSLDRSVSYFLEEQLDSIIPLSIRLGDQLPIISAYISGALVGILRWWVNHLDTYSKEEFIKFCNRRIDDLTKYFNEVLSK